MRLAVVGAGIAGLVAAYRLRRAFPEAELTVVEAADRVGGKLRTATLAGAPIDIGAEAFVGRRPEVPALLAELGLAEQLVHPSGLRPLVWAGGRLHPLPPGTLMGIPADSGAVRGLVDDATCAAIDAEPRTQLRWDRGADVSVGALVGERFGAQVVQRSVDPLLGGVYAGLADSIGVRAALPTLAAALDAGAPSLSEAVRRALPPPSAAPVFGGLRDGYGVLLDALVRAAGAKLVVGTPVSELKRVGDAWSIDPVGTVDAVVLAVPAHRVARLLADVAPTVARVATDIPLASSALVALALPAGTELPENSGMLIATGESLRAKAFTLSSRKWPHLAQRAEPLLRASFGRFGDPVEAWSDDELVGAAIEDLRIVTGVTVDPVDATVQRWPHGLPQYGPGHLDRVAAIREGIAMLPGLAVAGAYLQGVGVPACVASGAAAAATLTGAVAR